MADQPGSEIGVMNLPSEIDKKVADTHYLKIFSEQRATPLENSYLKSLAANMRTVNKRYSSNVLPLFTDGTPDHSKHGEILKALENWRSGTDPSCFNQIPETARMFKDNLGNNYQKLQPLYANLMHDANVIFTPVLSTLNNIENFDYMLDSAAMKWPQHVMERVARQIEKTPQIEKFPPQDVFNDLDALFKVLATEDKGFHLEFNIDPAISDIRADRYYFEGAIFNLIRNSQNILRQRADLSQPANVNVSMKLVDGKIVLQVRDNGGGFKPDMLMQATDKDGNPLRDSKGKEITTQKAFMRDVTEGTGGSGLGLDIVREISEDHLDGSVRAFNENYPETEQLGAVVEMIFPLS